MPACLKQGDLFIVYALWEKKRQRWRLLDAKFRLLTLQLTDICRFTVYKLYSSGKKLLLSFVIIDLLFTSVYKDGAFTLVSNL